MLEESSRSLTRRVVMMGDPATGKTSIIARYSDGKFTSRTSPTIGVAQRNVMIADRGCNIHLQIWDTAGQESFRSIVPIYFRRAQGALCVFDLTNKQTFDSLDGWIEEFTANADNGKVVIVGNKCDLINQIEVDEDNVSEWVKGRGLKYIRASACTGEGISEAFTTIAQLIAPVDLPEVREPEPQETPKNKKKCCQ